MPQMFVLAHPPRLLGSMYVRDALELLSNRYQNVLVFVGGLCFTYPNAETRQDGNSLIGETK